MQQVNLAVVRAAAACLQVLALQHPFIVPCVESWMVQDHTVNMIYGYCEKGDLCSYLQKVQRLVRNAWKVCSRSSNSSSTTGTSASQYTPLWQACCATTLC